MSKNLKWRVHTPNLLTEIQENAKQPALIQPINILKSILAELAATAIEINDDRLHELMIRLTLYSNADPESPDYDKELIEKYL